MSWLARSIASLTATDGDDDDDDEAGGVARRRDAGEWRSREETDVSPPPAEEGGGRGEGSGEVNLGRGVKEDLSELTKTLTRQLWGVASFLAPLPTSSSSPQPPSPSRTPSSAGEDSYPSDPIVRPDPTISKGSEYSDVVLDSPRMAGIRSDFAEIGGRFRSGISKLSANMAVTEISKMASSFLQFGADGEEETGAKDDEDEELEERYRSGGSSAIGVTEEVLAFARNISMHPETWLDFPLFPGDDVADDFDMSDAQQEHALAVEHLVPRLAALRIELCPSHMSEGCFWKIYFVLLHPRLNKQDSEFLSTRQIVEARAMLLQDLQNRTKSVTDRAGSGVTNWKEDGPSSTVATSGAANGSMPHKRSPSEEDDPTSDSETEKHPVISTEIKIVDKSVIEEEIPLQTKDIRSDASKISIEKYEDNGDEWLEEDNIEIGDSRTASIPIGNEDDVSFSDLEEDDEKAPTGSKAARNILDPQATGSKGWVHLGTDSGDSSKNSTSVSPGKKVSNEWSDLDDIDVM